MNRLWTKAIQAAPTHQRARHFLDLLWPRAQSRKGIREQIRVIVTLFSGSQALSNSGRNPQARRAGHRTLSSSATRQGLRRGIELAEKPAGGAGLRRGVGHLRRFKQTEMLRIAARDLSRLASTAEILRKFPTSRKRA
jgi:glutamine synthetase adenylyltransferase